MKNRLQDILHIDKDATNEVKKKLVIIIGGELLINFKPFYGDDKSLLKFYSYPHLKANTCIFYLCLIIFIFMYYNYIIICLFK